MRAHRQWEAIAYSRRRMEVVRLRSLGDHHLHFALVRRRPVRGVDVLVLPQPCVVVLPPFCEPSILCGFL